MYYTLVTKYVRTLMRSLQTSDVSEQRPVLLLVLRRGLPISISMINNQMYTDMKHNTYHIAGFICEVLNCVNYARGFELA